MSAVQRAVALGLALLAIWCLWRYRSVSALAVEVRAEEAAQRSFLARLTETAQDNQPLPPPPRPDTSIWLSAQALRGLERRVSSNSPIAGGAGAEIKVRNLKPAEVVDLFKQLTKVNLIVRHLELSDPGARSEWSLHLMVEVPRPEAAK